MARKGETALVQHILRWIRKNGGDGYHVHGGPYQRAGEPDIDGWLPGGIHIKFECKMPGQKPDPLQERRLEIYKQAQYFADWGCTLDEFVRKLELYAKGLDKSSMVDYNNPDRDIRLRDGV